MSDTKSSAPARPFPLGMARRGLSIGGVALVAVNLVLMMAGSAAGAGTMTSAVLWGGAAVCFLGAFVAFMLEPNEPPPSRPHGEPAADPEAAAASDDGGRAEGASPAARPTTRGRRAARRTPSRLRSSAAATPCAGCAAASPPLVGSLLALLLMAHAGQLALGRPARRALRRASPSWGVMDLLGTFDDADDRVAALEHARGARARRSRGFARVVRALLRSRSASRTAGRGLPQMALGHRRHR